MSRTPKAPSPSPVPSPSPAGGVREALDVPMGAIENGRVFAERLETTGLECPAGDLRMCSDWQEFRRCFDFLAEWAISVPARAAVERLDASLVGAAEAIPATPQNALIKALTICRATLPHMGGSAMATDSLLREINAALSSPATPEPVSAPAGEVVEAFSAEWTEKAREIYERCKYWPEKTPEGFMALLELRNHVFAALNPAPGHGEGGL